MATLLQKFRTAVLSTAHSVLDAVIDLNSIGAVKQHVRDLEASIDAVGDNLAGARGDYSGADRRAKRFQTNAGTLNAGIDTLLTDDDPTNDHQAQTLEAELMGVEELLAAETASRDAAATTVKALEQVYSTLKARHARMVQQISVLESKERLAEGQEKGAAALKAATGALDTGSAASVDSLTVRIERRADKAAETLKMAQDGFGKVADNDVALAQVSVRLAERKARLTASATK